MHTPMGPPETVTRATDQDLLSYEITFEEPSCVVAVHLVAAIPLEERTLVVSVTDPSHPGESVVRGPGLWKFSRTLRSDFLYSPQLNAGSIWSLDPANLRDSASSLRISVHPWGSKRSTLGLMSEAWMSAANDAGHVTIYRMGNS
jgi:hypothetical protein